MRRTRLHRGLLALALAAGSGWLACSEAGRERLRAHTYPPSFTYIPEERLRSTMWELADHVAQLDRRMRASGSGGDDLREQVLLELGGMQRAAASLGPGGWPSNHPEVSRNLDRFRQELDAARHAAELDPPKYFLAGSIAGACTSCHTAE